MFRLTPVLALGALMLGTNLFASTLCTDPTSCTLTFTEGNGGSGFGTGDFGTVTLTLNTMTDVATVDISLASGFSLIGTGFPGAVGFVDSLGGGLTIDNFSSSAYSGATSSTTNNQHFDGFGYSNDVAATTAPSAGSSNKVSTLSFDVSKGTSLTDVNDLVNLFSTHSGGAEDGSAYFVADVFNGNTSGPGAGNTGLIAVTGATSTVPEPATIPALLIGLGLLGWTVQRRRSQAIS